MPDIKRKPEGDSIHNVHTHTCPACSRNYSCNCGAQSDKQSLVCRDCEHGTYDPAIHGGTGRKSEA